MFIMLDDISLCNTMFTSLRVSTIFNIICFHLYFVKNVMETILLSKQIKNYGWNFLEIRMNYYT